MGSLLHCATARKLLVLRLCTYYWNYETGHTHTNNFIIQGLKRGLRGAEAFLSGTVQDSMSFMAIISLFQIITVPTHFGGYTLDWHIVLAGKNVI